jgi:predicted ABC-type transport system involved in lysophospholipase L1 biosynthesis ATPase subunit
VADNIMAILETRKDLDRDGRRKELESLLQEFHISHIRDNLGMSLSGGERRRVEIARALATAPSSSCSTNRSPASTRSRWATSSRSSITSRPRASAC